MTNKKRTVTVGDFIPNLGRIRIVMIDEEAKQLMVFL